LTARPEVELERLRRLAALVIAFLALVAGGALLAVLLLLEDSRSTDLRELALLSLLGGALGAASRGLIEIIERLNMGWELGDGTQVVRRRLRQERHREERARRAAAREEEALTRARAEAALPVEADEGRPLRADDHDLGPYEDVFGVYILPFLFLLPLVGAVLGVALFAGVTGGFLLASGEQEPTYSQPGLVFLSFLAGFFAETFLRRLASAADALFGVERREPDGREPPQSR
jgi:hypothetical protein